MIKFKKNIFIHTLALGIVLSPCHESFSTDTQTEDGTTPRILTRMLIRQQDPTVPSLDGSKFRQILIETNEPITAGPAIKDMAITKKNAVSPNETGDFIFSFPSREFNTASVFATVYKAFDLVGTDLKGLAEAYPNNTSIQTAHKQWENHGYKRLKIYPFDETAQNNAYYTRSDEGNRSIHFHPIKAGKVKGAWTSLSPDVIWHESWHGALDRFKPLYFTTDLLKTGAYHEAFGDMGALFGLLSDSDVCNDIVCMTKGDLHADSFLPKVAEEFGKAFGWKSLRNLEDDVKMYATEDEVHDRSRVLSGAVYDILASAYKDSQDLSSLDPTYRTTPELLLFDVAAFFRKMVIAATAQMPARDGTFRDFAKQLVNFASNHPGYGGSIFWDLKWKDYIIAEFEKREISLEKEAKAELKANAMKKLCAKEGVSICHTSVRKASDTK